MRTFLIMAAASLMAFTAEAQLDRVERSQAEIALEEAEENNAELRAMHADAIRGCAAKEADACFKLGTSHRRGFGGLPDYKKAAEAFRKSCTLGSGAGCASLAYLYNYGRGVDVDLAQSRLFYDKACKLDEVSGCAALGNMMFTGKGGRKDVTRGTNMLKDACSREYEWACERLTALGAYDEDDDTWDRLKDVKSRAF